STLTAHFMLLSRLLVSCSFSSIVRLRPISTLFPYTTLFRSEAGAAAVHFEDQLASVKKCGHMGGKVLVPTQEAVQKLVAARLAADVSDVPTLLVARTDADAADLLTSDCDPYDSSFLTGERTPEGFFCTHAGIDQAISRGLAYAPYADLV